MTDYSELLDAGRVKRGRFARRQVEDCVAIARRDLEAARAVIENSPEWSFNIAYNAMHQAGRALMFHAGYRAVGEGHHATVVRFLEIALGADFEAGESGAVPQSARAHSICRRLLRKTPPMYRSTNRRETLAEPELWFRIVHMALDGADGTRVAPPACAAEHRDAAGRYHEQAVEIALGPERAFVDGNLGTLTRRVAADRVVSAVPAQRGKPKPPREPKTPRVVELLRKALEWQALLESGEVPNQAEIARQEGITRARVTQIMGLLRLTPEIQQHILAMPDAVRRPAITERALRPISQLEQSRAQLQTFERLVDQH